MRVSRFFIDQELLPGSDITLDEPVCRYISQVLRMRVGQRFTLFDGGGSDFEAELKTADRRGCSARVIRETSREPPSRLKLHLGIGISRGERMDFAIQKSVELGVAAITPLFTARSMVQLKADRRDKRLVHWQGVIRSACEQSGRSLIPQLHPPTGLPEWLTAYPGGLMLHHKAKDTLATRPPPGTDLNLLIGPEGGLSEAERMLAVASGFTGVRLGPRVLRTETAPIAALAAIQVLWGDFR
jgi:16S rRNA (uracil1498-N3)-methyltransferase